MRKMIFYSLFNIDQINPVTGWFMDNTSLLITVSAVVLISASLRPEYSGQKATHVITQGIRQGIGIVHFVAWF